MNQYRVKYQSVVYESQCEAIMKAIFNNLNYNADYESSGEFSHPDFILHGFKDFDEGVKIEVKSTSYLMPKNTEQLYTTKLRSGELSNLYIVHMPSKSSVRTVLDLMKYFSTKFDKSYYWYREQSLIQDDLRIIKTPNARFLENLWEFSSVNDGSTKTEMSVMQDLFRDIRFNITSL